jgi:sigma-B regulation protein RsbU (phosphoserine phosphatase)
VNAGHNPPLIVRAQNPSPQLFHLKAEAIPVGIFPDAKFETTRFDLMIDDILVAYTDGITEAANPSGELWGLERLERLLLSCGKMSSAEIVERILSEVSDFANGEAQRDDVTLVVMKVQEGCEV